MGNGPRATRGDVPLSPDAQWALETLYDRIEADEHDDEESGPPNCPGMGIDDLCTWPDVDGCGLCRPA